MKTMEYALIASFTVVLVIAFFSTFMQHVGGILDTVLTIN